MDENIQEYFLKSNKLFIEEIKHSLAEAEEEPSLEETELWKNSLVWQNSVLPNLNELIEKYGDDIPTLAKFQIGLAKYLDYFFMDWATDENQNIMKNRVSEIVLLASQIVRVYVISKKISKPCGKHEDGACIEELLGRRYSNGQDVNFFNSRSGKWPTLPFRDAVNFLDRPVPKLLCSGTYLYRIIDLNNNPYGSWWICDVDLKSKEEWRKYLAVRKVWNNNEYYVDFKVNDNDLKVWKGEAASQQASSNCILPGGKMQTWIDPTVIKTILISQVKPIKRWPII